MHDFREPSFRTEPEPILAVHAPRKISPSGLLNPPGRWRTLLTFTIVMLALLGSAFATAFLVYQQNAAQRVREQLQSLLQMAELDEPDGYRRIIATLEEHAELLGREETGERIARYVLHLALAHGDTAALGHAAEACSLAETRSRIKGQHCRKVFDIARLLTQRKYDQAQLEAEKALIRFPRSDMLLYELSLARIYLGAWDAADATLEMASMLGQSSRIPVLVERAALMRRRGNPMEALQLVDEVLRISPRHPVALLEKQLCLAGAGKNYALPATRGELLPVAVRSALLQAHDARRRGNFAGMLEACSHIPETEPDFAWCRAQAFSFGPMDPREFAPLVPKLEVYPFPDAPCLLADFYLANFRLDAALPQINACQKNIPGNQNGHAVRRIAAALLDRNESALRELCPPTADPDVLWPCLDAAVRLNLWDQVRELAKAPGLTAQDRKWLETLFFTDAFSLVTTAQPPLRDCSPRSRLLRRLWAAAALAAGRESDAVSWTRFTLDACPASLHNRLDHIEILVRAGYASDAMKMLENLGEMDHPEGMFRAGKAALAAGMRAAAGYWATTLRRRFPEDFRGFLLLAQIALEAGQWKEFQEHFENVRSSGQPEAMELEAVWETHQGRISVVENLLGAMASRLHPGSAPEAWMQMARRIQPEYPLIAARWRQTAAQLWMAQKSPASASRAWVEYIRNLDPVSNSQEIRKTAGLIRQLPLLHPAACVFLHHYLYAENRENPAAAAYLERAVELAPENPEYRMLYGKYLANRDPARAAEQFRRILSLRPSAFSEEARTQLQSIAPEKP